MGSFEVQLLRFSLPPGARARGPTAHVKVRAPDADGQRNRVRAYSMRLNAVPGDEGKHTSSRESGTGTGTKNSHMPTTGPDGRSSHRSSSDENALGRNRSLVPTAFTLTVKIYPGGPPRTRGTSAYLGALPIGSAIHVPETRTMEWAVKPTMTRRVGIVAFGVGIAECLDVMEILLEAGAEVRLVYANRNERQILYRSQLQHWLRAYPSTLHVRHCLSRPLATSPPEEVHEDAVLPRIADDTTDGECAAVSRERLTNGRADAAVLAEEFVAAWGDEESQEAHYLVVGTGAMERSAWGWLKQLGVSQHKHLLRGTRWLPLVPADQNGN